MLTLLQSLLLPKNVATFALSVVLGLSNIQACKKTDANSVSTATPVQTARQPSSPNDRDKFLWPFASTSPWNTPIGSDAKYSPAGLKPAPRLRIDKEYFFKLKKDDPMRPVYSPGSWNKRCSKSGNSKPMGISLPVPDDLIIADARKGNTPNNASAFLMPDGKTLVQLEPLARCTQGGPVFGHRAQDVDIYGQGIEGAHFGSGLSSIGGSIRVGELTGKDPIRHALKLNLWGKKYLYYSKQRPGFRWPATRSDKHAKKQYQGKNPELLQGSLLAIPPDVSEKELDLQTPAAKKIFNALQDYGAYVVDDTGWDIYGFPMEHGVVSEFQQKYDYSLNTSDGPFYEDMMKIFTSLSIVVNNGPDSIGGGGIPRAPLAPPITN